MANAGKSGPFDGRIHTCILYKYKKRAARVKNGGKFDGNAPKMRRAMRGELYKSNTKRRIKLKMSLVIRSELGINSDVKTAINLRYP